VGTDQVVTSEVATDSCPRMPSGEVQVVSRAYTLLCRNDEEWKMLQRVLLCAALSGVISAPLFAQLDRAAADPRNDVTRDYKAVVQSVEKNDRDGATSALKSLDNSIDAVDRFSAAVPDQLSNGNLRDLAAGAKAFLEAERKFRVAGRELQSKVEKVGESTSSELSTLKGAYEEYEKNFKSFLEDMTKAGQALKQSCGRCVN